MPEEQGLPPYTYIPGRNPHPISHPAGHRQVAPAGDLEIELEHDQWLTSRTCQQAFQLFAAGYYWEAHEVWEALWKRLPEDSVQRLLVQGWIKLAAAGVKCLEGNQNGAERHARRSAELLSTVRDSTLSSSQLQELGYRWVLVARRIQDSPPVQSAPRDGSHPAPLPGFSAVNTP